MIKVATPFQIVDRRTKDELFSDDLSIYLATKRAREPFASEWGAFGFSTPPEFGNVDLVYDGAGGVRILNFEFHERILPGAVIKRAVQERRKEVEERQTAKLNRKQYAELREEVIAAMLPKTLVRVSHIRVYIKGDLLLISTASVKVVDLVIHALVEALNHVPLALRNIGMAGDRWNVSSWLQTMAYGNEDTDFTVNEHNACLTSGSKAIRLKEVSVFDEPVQNQLRAGMQVSELGLMYEKKVDFSLTAKMMLRRIRFSDILHEDADSDDMLSAFDSEVAIATGVIFQMLKLIMARTANEDDEL